MRLNYVWNIALTDLRVYFSDRGNLITLTILPIILTFMLGLFVGGNAASLRVDIVDLDDSDLSAQFIEDLRAVNDTLVLCPMDATGENGANCRLDELDDYEAGAALTVEQARQRVSDEVVSAAVVIPEGYAASIDNLENVQIDYYSTADITTGDAVRQAVDAVIQQVNGSMVAARVGGGVGDVLDIFDGADDRQQFTQNVYQNANDQWTSAPVSVDYALTEQGTSEAPGGFTQSVPGMATMFVMFTVLGGMAILLRERKSWTLQRMIMMPITRAEILGGKIVSRFLLGLTQFVIIFVFGLFFGVDFGSNLPGILLIMIAYTLSITAMSLALAPFFEDEVQAGTAVTLISLPLAALGGAWWPLEIVPEFMRIIGHLSPVAWAMDGFNEMIFYGGGLGEIVLPVLVLLGFSAVFFALGIVNFRYND